MAMSSASSSSEDLHLQTSDVEERGKSRVDLRLGSTQTSGKPVQSYAADTPASPPSTHLQRPSLSQRRSSVTPKERFRNTVNKVIRLRRATAALAGDYINNGVGAEPGVDPRHETAFLRYGHIHEACQIDVVDYSSIRSTHTQFDNKGLVTFLNDVSRCTRPAWTKVRWFNVKGVSWDVVSSLALRYAPALDLHPLAVEDVLHQERQAPRSKADYYPRHLFLRLLCHSVPRFDTEKILKDESGEPLPRSSSPSFIDGNEGYRLQTFASRSTRGAESAGTFNGSTLRGSIDPDSRFSTHTAAKRDGYTSVPTQEARNHPPPRILFQSMSSKIRPAAHEKPVEEITLDALKQKEGDRVQVKIEPMYIFLLRDSTVISFSSVADTEFTAPILNRLRQRDTGLRTSADASLLVQSLLDLIVDQALEVVDEYQGTILKLEQSVLIRPKMQAIRALHILSGDLILHKRTLGPLKTVIYGLRRYDLDRCAALIDSDLLAAGEKVQGFMSSKSKIYLADVHDHMEYILSSIDMFELIAENLIDYTFNLKSYDMNEVMRRLTLCTIIFLPLTLLAGYFGMNFASMWSVLTPGHSDVIYWIIALPVTAIITFLFSYRDLEKMWHYIMKKTVVSKTLKGASY